MSHRRCVAANLMAKRTRAAARALLLVIAAMRLGMATGAIHSAEPAFPTAAWQEKSPAELGLNVEAAEAVPVALGGRGCIVKDGFVVKAWGDQAEKGDWYSSAKPVLSTLLMFAIQEGKVADADARIADFGWDLSAKDQSMTFRHLGAMTSSYARPEPPGAAWAYNDFAIQLYQLTLFDRVFRADPNETANAPTRFGQLQLQDGLEFRRNRRLFASVRDFARLAWLWQNRGRWGDAQMLRSDLVDDFLRPQAPADLPNTAPAETNDYLQIGSYGGGSDHFSKAGPGVYGFNWWFNGRGPKHPQHNTWPDAPADTVMSIGRGGNCSVLMPSLGLMVVCAEGDFGPNHAGDAASVMNQRLKLIAHVARPTVSQSTGPQATAQHSSDAPAQPAVEPAYHQWHTIALDFHGPDTSESATPNPFTDYRLDVEFRHEKQTIVVPGYYAADGRAADSGAADGNFWQVKFAPDAVGHWTYRASFRQGPLVAVADDVQAGEPAAGDDAQGEFDVLPSTATGADFRARGLLKHTGDRYLRFAGSGEVFLKGGADSPENMLAYYEFDGTKPTHRFGPHMLDALPDDLTWRDGRGRNLCGAFNYLASKGVNSVYLLTMNVKGDGKDVWPWTDAHQRLRFDVSKLAQWDIAFSHAERRGVALHLVTQETENDQLLDGGELGPERKLYYRELVARFGHHLSVVWNLGEENTNTTEQLKAFARWLQMLDPSDHPIVVHTFPKQQTKVYEPLLGDGNIDGASLQTNDTRAQTRMWIERSRQAGRQWFVCLDEIGPADTGVKPDAVDYGHDEVRRDHLWGHFMSGGAGVEWLFGYKYAHHDIGLEDFRSRDHLWELTRIAVEFFGRHVAIDRLQPADELSSAAGGHCLAEPGKTYVIYLPRGGTTELNLTPGTYTISWFNPRVGGSLVAGNIDQAEGPGPITVGLPPRDPDQDWICLVRRQDDSS